MLYNIKQKIYNFSFSNNDPIHHLKKKHDYLTIAFVDDKYGIVDESEHALIPFEYDYISAISTGLFLLIKDGKCGIAYFEQFYDHVNKQSNIQLIKMIECNFDIITTLGSSHGIILRKDGEFKNELQAFFTNPKSLTEIYNDYEIIGKEYLVLRKDTIYSLYSMITGEMIYSCEKRIVNVFIPRFLKETYIADRIGYTESNPGLVIYVTDKENCQLIYIKDKTQRIIGTDMYIYAVRPLNMCSDNTQIVSGFIVLKEGNFELYNSDLSYISRGPIEELLHYSQFRFEDDDWINFTLSKIDAGGELHETHFINKTILEEESVSLSAEFENAISEEPENFISYNQKYIKETPITTIEFTESDVQISIYYDSCLEKQSRFPYEIISYENDLTVGRFCTDKRAYFFEYAKDGFVLLESYDKTDEINEKYNSLGQLIEEMDYSGVYLTNDENINEGNP